MPDWSRNSEEVLWLKRVAGVESEKSGIHGPWRELSKLATWVFKGRKHLSVLFPCSPGVLACPEGVCPQADHSPG